MRSVRISAPSVGTALVAVAIGAAFADSSIVVLALPQLLGEFDTSITGVSWVITAYNLVVAVVALGLGRRLARSAARRVAVAGLIVFLAGSLACALANSLEVLVALRCVQGVGAALLLTAALPVLVALTGSERRGTGVWIAAGALFLVVVLLVDVWRLSPIEAAAAVTALPVATFVGGRLERRLVGVPAAVTGALTLAAGLLGLALLPATNVALVVWALALCGAGLGLALPFFATRSLAGPDLSRSAARSVGARHAGLVLALVLVAPVLAHSVDTATDDAALGGASVVLDAPVGIADKVSVALALDKVITATPKGQMPDVAQAFEGRSGDDVEQLQDDLVDTLEGTLTRAFRSSFGLTAAFALLACLPALALRRRT